MAAKKEVITEIKTQEKHPERVSIFLGGKFWKGVSKEVVLSLNLQVNVAIDATELEKIVYLEEKKKALDYSVRLLAFRGRSTKELESRLGKRGFSEEVQRETIRKLEQLGYLDDLAFAQMWISERFRAKNLGRNRVRRELAFKGVDRAIIDEVLSGYSEQDEFNRAFALAQKKHLQCRDLDDRKRCDRLYRFLLYKGFDTTTAAEISKKVARLEDENFDAGSC